MDDVGMRGHAAGVDERVETSLANLATAFHAPEGRGAAERRENRELFTDFHGGGEETTLGLCEG
jgi:hypothetical protein